MIMSLSAPKVFIVDRDNISDLLVRANPGADDFLSPVLLYWRWFGMSDYVVCTLV